MPILVEHWGGKFAILPQFCPIFNIRGDKPWPRFFSRQQIKCTPKKKSSPKFQEVFSPISSDSHADHSHIIGVDADVDLSQVIGGGAVKLLGGIYNPVAIVDTWPE